MAELWDIFISGYQGYASYLWGEISHPDWHNYFYALTFVSLIFFILEMLSPWRTNQAVLRRDFWLDLFYMYFNFFIFSLLIYNAGTDVFVHLFRKLFFTITTIDLSSLDPLGNWPIWAILFSGFIIRDFIQWWTHRLLHRVSWLWQFHKVHHSVKEMGFAAHLRYHWMETIVYRTIEYIPLALLGIGLYDFFIIHIFSLLIGHFNHSNMTVSPRITGIILGVLMGLLLATNGLDIQVFDNPTLLIGGLVVTTGGLVGYFVIARFIRFLFNNPEMHIWHHAKNLPENHKYGVNFGLSLAIWDYIFGTSYIPYDGKDIELGFPDDQHFPQTFLSQITYGFVNQSDQLDQ